MSEEYGPDFVSITDDEGNEFELEHLGTLEYNGREYMAFVPADMDEDDEDFGLILLKVIEEDGETLLADVDDEAELNAVYEKFMEELFEDDDEELGFASQQPRRQGWPTAATVRFSSENSKPLLGFNYVTLPC